MRGVIKGVLAEELENSLRMKKEYKGALGKLPKGCLAVRKIRGHEYCYLVKRIDKKVKYIYKGKLSEEERREFLKELGIEEPAINMLTRLCIKALDLISFFTVGEDEVRQWTIRAASSAPEAAGAIHSDLQKGFIRAEVMKYGDFVACGSEQKVKESGKLYLKGKDYIVEDGDILNIRFNV